MRIPNLVLLACLLSASGSVLAQQAANATATAPSAAKALVVFGKISRDGKTLISGHRF